MKIKYFSAALAVAAVVALALSVQRVPEPPQFCDECVMAHEITSWQFAGRTLFQTTRDSVTPVSELLAERHACPAHAHQWSSPVRVAEADLETGEAPRIRSVGFLNAPRTVNFLRGLFANLDATTIASWRAVAWQPTLAAALELALRFRRFPEAGFAKREDYLAWWNESAYPLFNKLNEMTVAD